MMMMTPVLSRRSRRGGRGFSLIEAMMAAVIFLVGFTGVTAMMINASTRRTRATKRALVGRMAYDEYTRTTLPGYNALPAAGTYVRTDTDAEGRRVTFTTIVSDTCVDVDTTFGAMPLPGGQACCPGDICCKTVRIEARSVLNPEVTPPVEIVDNYVGFVTRGCGP